MDNDLLCIGQLCTCKAAEKAVRCVSVLLLGVAPEAALLRLQAGLTGRGGGSGRLVSRR